MGVEAPLLGQAKDTAAAACINKLVNSRCGACIKKSLSKWNLFYFFWLLSGQYINFSKGCSYRTCSSTLGLSLFIGHSFVYIVYAGITLTVEVSRIANLSFVMDKSSTNNESETIICTLPQEHWKFTTAIIFSTFSAFFSYVIITIFILFPLICRDKPDCKHWCKPDECITGKCANKDQCKKKNCDNECTPDKCKCVHCKCDMCKYEPIEGCCTTYKKARKYGTLSPYDDDDELSTKDKCCFFTNYIVIMLALFFCGIGTSAAYIKFVYHQTYCKINILSITMTVLHLNSQFCAIQSCFIFSKIVYVVTNRLNKLDTKMDCVDYENLNEHDGIEMMCKEEFLKKENGQYYWLREIDKVFIKEVKPTLDLLGVWFIFHWIAYAITTMLLSAFIVQVIIDVIRYGSHSVGNMMPTAEPGITASYVCYVVIFTLVHAYLFLYPCFRAAAIGTARAKMIGKLTNKNWYKFPLDDQLNFIQYLKTQKFSFRVSLFCTNMSFGFNWVFVSFFIAICGAYLRF